MSTVVTHYIHSSFIIVDACLFCFVLYVLERLKLCLGGKDFVELRECREG